MAKELTHEERMAKTARTNKLRLLIDALMILTAVFLTLTSIVKLPFPTSWFDYLQEKGLYECISFNLLSYTHDIAGIIFLLSLVFHLVLNWKRLTWLIKAMLK